MSHFEHLRHQVVGTVEFVSPREIKVLLETNAPLNTAINTGVPQPFPKVNGFVLIPSEVGALIGLISWIGIEYSPYPKRSGYKDFDLVDLPFPLRKLSLAPVGVLKEQDGLLQVDRGVFSYPSVGDVVVIPNHKELRAIVQNKDFDARVRIGTVPAAANAPLFVDPDRMFGRHLAILGNTGSGKSCSVAGLIRWSLEEAKRHLSEDERLNSRFIVLDPNGEYGNCFNDLSTVRRFEIVLDDHSLKRNQLQLRVPNWMWNSYEWSSIGQASGKTQRPLLRQALREVRNGGSLGVHDDLSQVRLWLTSLLVSLRNFERMGVAIASWPEKDNLGATLESGSDSLGVFLGKLEGEQRDRLHAIIDALDDLLARKPKGKNYPGFSLADITPIISLLEESQVTFGTLESYEGPDEDSPIFFKTEEFLAHLERLALENKVAQFMDFFMMRVKSVIKDPRIASVIQTETEEEVRLDAWLNEYVGCNEDDGSITVLDLSLVPSEIVFVIVSVLARIIFEAHQRYRKETGNVLPSVLVVEEAHNFIKRYEAESEEITARKLCSQSFEKIAKEGRKFGLGLVVSSQRPSELSQTVLSQCNTFLLHRIVNDKDQEMVKRLVPDNLGGLLNELPVLPTQKAILLGWASPIPVVVEMNTLSGLSLPKSKDPEFWDVWTGKEERIIEWDTISRTWQKETES